MTDAKQLTADRVVAAPADAIFALLSDPQQHSVLDGSGTLRGTDAGPVTEKGQVFAMRMHRDDMGDYRTLNTVVAFEPGTTIGWAPMLDPDCELYSKLTHIKLGGQTYTYHLTPAEGGTSVRQVYDWSGVTDPQFEAFCPFVSTEHLDATLANLARAVEG
jgi:hypothetical protein